MSLAESCVYAEGSIKRKTHGDGRRRGIMFAQSANQADIIGLPPQGVGLYRQATA